MTSRKPSWSRQFALAAAGKHLIDRDAFCAALGISDYPKVTLFWEEWCRWLYRKLAGKKPPRRILHNTLDVSGWWCELLQPLIEEREEQMETDNDLRKGILEDGFAYDGHKKIVTVERMWYVVARMESYTRGRHRVVMLLHYNELVSGSIEWAVLVHDRPRDRAALQKARIDKKGSLEEALQEYNRRCADIAADGAASYQQMLGRLGAEALEIGRGGIEPGEA